MCTWFKATVGAGRSVEPLSIAVIIPCVIDTHDTPVTRVLSEPSSSVTQPCCLHYFLNTPLPTFGHGRLLFSQALFSVSPPHGDLPCPLPLKPHSIALWVLLNSLGRPSHCHIFLACLSMAFFLQQRGRGSSQEKGSVTVSKDGTGQDVSGT